MNKKDILLPDDTSKMMQTSDFIEVYNIIITHRQRAAATIDNEMLIMIWEVGRYVSSKLKSSAWGDGVVRQLAEYIHTQDPTTRGWSYRTIYKMVQFYDTYSTESFLDLLKSTKMINYNHLQQTLATKSSEFVPVQMAQIPDSTFMPFEMAQIPAVLFVTGWTNHQLILNRCKSDSERLFYILYAGHERLKNKELERAIKTNTMTTLLGSKNVQSAMMQQTYPLAQVLFKDTAYFDMMGLPKQYKETKLRKSIVKHMKDFILELGKDFLFIDEEHRVTVGSKTFMIDLLFYHRRLQCMVAFELKTTEFRPAYQGQLEFYLEALDQEERRSNENPTIGIILCKESDQDVIRFAINRSMSPLMVMQYKEELKVGGVIQRSLVEYCKYINEE